MIPSSKICIQAIKKHKKSTEIIKNLTEPYVDAYKFSTPFFMFCGVFCVIFWWFTGFVRGWVLAEKFPRRYQKTPKNYEEHQKYARMLLECPFLFSYFIYLYDTLLRKVSRIPGWTKNDWKSPPRCANKHNATTWYHCYVISFLNDIVHIGKPPIYVLLICIPLSFHFVVSSSSSLWSQ